MPRSTAWAIPAWWCPEGIFVFPFGAFILGATAVAAAIAGGVPLKRG